MSKATILNRRWLNESSIHISFRMGRFNRYNYSTIDTMETFNICLDHELSIFKSFEAEVKIVTDLIIL